MWLLCFCFPFKGRIQGIRRERSTTPTLSDRGMRCYSYYSPPLVGKLHEEDTITTYFDWKKQKPILLVDRWKDQTATATGQCKTQTAFYTQSAFYPWSAVRSPQSAFYTDRNCNATNELVTAPPKPRQWVPPATQARRTYLFVVVFLSFFLL